MIYHEPPKTSAEFHRRLREHYDNLTSEMNQNLWGWTYTQALDAGNSPSEAEQLADDAVLRGW